MDELIAAKLLADATIAGLIGTRLYWAEGEQGCARPYVVYEQDEEPRSHYNMGVDPNRIRNYEFEAWADNPEDAETVADAIEAELGGFYGTLGAYKVDMLTCEGRTTLYDVTRQAAGMGVHGVGIDFRVIYQ
jgi:hypothetical protein